MLPRRPCLNLATASLLIYLLFLGFFTLVPFDFSMAPSAEKTRFPVKTLIFDALLNTFGFVPFGVVLFFVIKPLPIKMLSKWGLTICMAGILSFLIEAGQMFLPTRFPSPYDILANMFGGGLGFWLAHRYDQEQLFRDLQRYGPRLALLIVTTYLVALTSFFLWAATIHKLEGWDPTYHLLIGNEATLDRPWLGKIFILALYDRVLRPDEIESAFQAGPHFDPTVHLEGMPVILYPFREGKGRDVHDHSPISPPIDLTIEGPPPVWIPEGGLELTRPMILRSSETPQKVYQRFTTTDTFSVVAWIEPKDVVQTGPARIVSFSWDPYLRNFTLGQEGSEIHFRVRNWIAGPNGVRVDLRTKNLGLSPVPTHIVAIYDRGIEQLYINGVHFHSLKISGGLALIATALGMDTPSYWQRGPFLVVLLLGPLGVFWWVLKKVLSS